MRPHGSGPDLDADEELVWHVVNDRRTARCVIRHRSDGIELHFSIDASISSTERAADRVSAQRRAREILAELVSRGWQVDPSG